MTAVVLFHNAPVASAEEPKRFPYEAQVAVPVADLRKEPSPAGPTLQHDPLEESQLLYGDRVQVLEEKQGWARVAVPDQQEWTHHQRWEGYPGWIRLSDIVRDDVTLKPVGGIGNKHKATGTPVRKEIVQAAREFIGTPYYWGGRSSYDSKANVPPHRGVDCSGLVGLAYQANDVLIPRDAHEQWMKALPINREQLQPGDLVFLSDPKNPQKITHVMLYAGDGRVIEGPGTGKKVREGDLEARVQEAQAEGRRVYFGTYFSAHGSTSSP